MTRPLLLDLCCCEGGAAMGYFLAGFDVVGVDREPRFAKRYPFEFHAADALEFVREHGHEFDAIHASWPCQAYTIATAGNLPARDKYDRLIEAGRDALEATGLPWVMENVEGARAELRDPVMLCGRMFDLRAEDEDGYPLVLNRHRLFESNVHLAAPEHPTHGSEQVAGVYGGARRSSKPGATPADDRHAARYERHGGYVPRSKRVQQQLLGIDWMTVKGMQESLPPAYTQHVGAQLIQHVGRAAA